MYNLFVQMVLLPHHTSETCGTTCVTDAQLQCMPLEQRLPPAAAVGTVFSLYLPLTQKFVTEIETYLLFRLNFLGKETIRPITARPSSDTGRLHCLVVL